MAEASPAVLGSHGSIQYFFFILDVNTIDWSRNDLIATSVANSVLVGNGFAEKYKSPETVTEYEEDRAMAVNWSADGIYLGVGTENGVVQIWNIISKKLIFEEVCCPDKNCNVTSLQWHPTNRTLVW